MRRSRQRTVRALQPAGPSPLWLGLPSAASCAEPASVCFCLIQAVVVLDFGVMATLEPQFLEREDAQVLPRLPRLPRLPQLAQLQRLLQLLQLALVLLFSCRHRLPP